MGRIVKLLMTENQMDGDIYTTNPSWNDVEKSLISIDGNLITYVGLYKDEEPDSDEFLLIGGGDSGNYVCSYYNDGDEYYLVNPRENEPDKLVEIPIGQMNVKPKKYFNNLEIIISTVKFFYETGKMLDSAQWDLT